MTQDFAQGPGEGFIPDRVVVDADFKRIVAIPRAPWDEAPDLDQLTRDLTAYLRVPGGERPCPGGHWEEQPQIGPCGPEALCSVCRSPRSLRPIQAALLRALYDRRGVFGSVSVGGGKTLPSVLAGTLLGVKWPLLIVPASLIYKTLIDVSNLARHWRVHPVFLEASAMSKAEFRRKRRCLLSYEELGRDAGGLKLVQADPDLVVLDECQRVKARRAAVTRKVGRAVSHWRKSKDVPMMAMSGSVADRSFGEYWLPIKWSLGSYSPLPLDLRSFLSWCYALDQSVPEFSRLDPGPLEHLSPDARGDTPLSRARDAYAQRFSSNPAVISSKDNVPPYALTFKIERLACPDAVRLALKELRETWSTPDGQEFENAIELWVRERWLSKGGWYVWSPSAPVPWRSARKARNQFINEILKDSKSLDSPEQVESRVDSGVIRDPAGVLAAWRAVQPTFTPNSVWRWLPQGSQTMLEHAAAWLKSTNRAIVWCEHNALGQALSAMTGVPYYSEGATDPNGNHVMNAKGKAICSFRGGKSCAAGVNLQFEFSHNYLLEITTKGDVMEQLLGRTHRGGQREDEVTVTIPLMTVGDAKALQSAINGARYAFESRREPQKLVYGTWLGDPWDEKGLV